MTSYLERDLHPVVAESIRRVREYGMTCGCDRRAGKVWLCDYHDGMADGLARFAVLEGVEHCAEHDVEWIEAHDMPLSCTDCCEFVPVFTTDPPPPKRGVCPTCSSDKKRLDGMEGGCGDGWHLLACACGRPATTYRAGRPVCE